jgi:hypothetical protein
MWHLPSKALRSNHNIAKKKKKKKSKWDLKKTAQCMSLEFRREVQVTSHNLSHQRDST